MVKQIIEIVKSGGHGFEGCLSELLRSESGSGAELNAHVPLPRRPSHAGTNGDVGAVEAECFSSFDLEFESKSRRRAAAGFSVVVAVSSSSSLRSPELELEPAAA